MTYKWFTSDLHFGHQRIIELCNRPFRDVADMNDQLVGRWNDVVEDTDSVYILGDLAMGSIKESLALVKTLKGNKFLVPGNHDRVHPCYPQRAAKGEEMRRMYEDAGLVITSLEVDYLPSREYRDGDQAWKLCHFPVAGDHTADDRYPEYRPTVNEDQWLIHGHVHDLWRVKGKQINVGVDAWGYTPVMEESLMLIMDNGVSEAFAANKDSFGDPVFS